MHNNLDILDITIAQVPDVMTKLTSMSDDNNLVFSIISFDDTFLSFEKYDYYVENH